MSGDEKKKTEESGRSRSDVFTDVALTLPLFVAYHLGVVFLPVRNAADPVTTELQALAQTSLVSYAGLTLAIGAAFAAVLWVLGKGEHFSSKRFALVAIEGLLYGLLMRAAGAYVVGAMRLGPPEASAASGPFAGLVMSLGAGLYEEIAFRVVLYGGGAWLVKRVVGEGSKRLVALAVWAVATAAVFSAWHYVGPMSDDFTMQSFVFRAVCGLVLVLIYALRGFAPAVYTHALYDAGVMVL